MLSRDWKSAQRYGVGHRSHEVVYLDVEVHHRALSTWDRGHIVFGALEDHVDRLLRRLDHGGVGLLVNDWPIEQRRGAR
jgi:hypothetical protein